MEREQIIDIINRKIDYSDMEKAKKILSRNYDIEIHKADAEDIKITLSKGNPVAIRNHLIIGYDNLKKAFEDSDGDFFQIERPIEAVTIKEEIDNREPFAIIGRNEWDRTLHDFLNIIEPLKIGEVFLPGHSAIFNFLNPDEETKKKKIQSVLSGVQINVYEPLNYVDNCLHEMGHLFWRTCMKFDEKMQFKELHKYLKPSAIYEYEWERSDEQEVFCTIYKWYLKSILINKSFYNILEFEEPQGLKLLQQVMERKAKDQVINDIWEMSKHEVMEYFNPKFDKTSGKYIRKQGLAEKIKDIELPGYILNQIESVQEGVPYIAFGKAIVPVCGNMIDFEKYKMKPLEKAEGKKTILLDMDGVVTWFSEAYKTAFDRDVFKDDSFTVTQMCLTQPHFFRTIPVLQRGKELYDRLSKKYNVIFLTTPMEGIEHCKADKLAWLKENICENPTVIFSQNKSDYAHSAHDILVDDMTHNLESFAEAGGTAIDFTKHTNDEIMDKIADTLNPQKEIKIIKEQIKNMQVNTSPTEKQKESGIYQKGRFVIKGIPVVIENPKGSVRWGIGENGRKWVSKMKSHYGYIQHKGEAIDGDKVDVFIGDKFSNNKVFVINQGKNNMFDEHKVMIGYPDINTAKESYLACYEKGWEKNIMSIIPTNTKKLKDWLKSGNMNEPYRD